MRERPARSAPERSGGSAAPVRHGRRLGTGLLTAIALALTLTACGAPAPAPGGASAKDAPKPKAAAVSTGCPQKLVQDIETAHGPAEQHDLETIDAALAVRLPTASSCVLTVEGDAEGSTFYRAYFPQQGDSFATAVKDAFSKAGYRPSTDGSSFDAGASDGRIDVLAAGDQDLSDYFGGAAVVLVSGQFDGAPGMTASPVAGAGSGSGSLTWRSSCMLTLAEMNAAWRSTGIAFGGPAASDDDSTACEYEQTGVDLPLDVDIDFRPYSATGSYGWVSLGDPSWTAPSAKEGAANACAASTSHAASTGRGTPECTRVGDARIVIGGDRTEALVFRPGDYFTVVQLLNGSGFDDSETASLEAMTKILAGRAPERP